MKLIKLTLMTRQAILRPLERLRVEGYLGRIPRGRIRNTLHLRAAAEAEQAERRSAEHRSEDPERHLVSPFGRKYGRESISQTEILAIEMNRLRQRPGQKAKAAAVPRHPKVIPTRDAMTAPKNRKIPTAFSPVRDVSTRVLGEAGFTR